MRSSAVRSLILITCVGLGCHHSSDGQWEVAQPATMPDEISASDIDSTVLLSTSQEDDPGAPRRDSRRPSRSKPKAPSASPRPKQVVKKDQKPAVVEWASFLGPNGDGTSPETGLLTSFPETGPQELWRAELGSGYSGLTVAGGKVFTLFGQKGREYAGAFDALSGQPSWKVDLDEDFAQGRSPGPRSTPCVDGDRVYVLGASGQLHCLETATGKPVWKDNLIGTFQIRLHDEGLAASPLIDGQQLIILAGRSVYALDKMTGDLLWKALDEPMNHSSPMIRTINGERQIVVLSGRNLVGLSPEGGEEFWRHPQEAVNIMTPVVGPEGQIFMGAAYGFGCQLVQVSNTSVRQLYKNSVLAPHVATPVLYKGHLYGFHDRPGVFKCVDFATGTEKWNTRKTVKGNILIADGQIIVINEEGELLLAPATPDDFQPTARARLFQEGLCYTAPTLGNGLLYVRSDKELVCVSLRK